MVGITVLPVRSTRAAPFGDQHVGAAAGSDEAVALHNEGGVLDDGAVASDQAGAFEDSHRLTFYLRRNGCRLRLGGLSRRLGFE